MAGGNKNVAEMQPGEVGIVAGFTDDYLSVKLMEMGCIPGETIVVEQVAPLGGPMNIRVAGYMLSLRRDEAEHIVVEVIKN